MSQVEVAQQVVEENQSVVQSPKKDQILQKIKKLFSDKLSNLGSKVAIFTHSTPDPDAVGSMMGIYWLLNKAYGAECDCFYGGCISHPQNIAMVNLLDPNLRPLEEYDSNNDYKLFITVDSVPSNTATPENNEIKFDLAIDHHKEVPNGGFKGLFYNLKAGSCCATVYNLIKSYNLEFEDENDRDSKIATAMMVGITTDTEHMLSDDATEYEFKAYSDLFKYRNSTALKQIVNYKRPKSWVDAKAVAASKAILNADGIAIVGVGFLNIKQRDLIADVADELMTWANVETAIAFAVVDGDKIEGSVRSNNASIAIPSLCKELGANGNGGGKLGKGAYRYGFGGIKVEEDSSEETRNKMWEFVHNYEVDRVLAIFRK
jgi:nanoRNase/pAp phosphatase (c-di-AMP/oligoRNAs hydrolase)